MAAPEGYEFDTSDPFLRSVVETIQRERPSQAFVDSLVNAYARHHFGRGK